MKYRGNKITFLLVKLIDIAIYFNFVVNSEKKIILIIEEFAEIYTRGGERAVLGSREKKAVVFGSRLALFSEHGEIQLHSFLG